MDWGGHGVWGLMGSLAVGWGTGAAAVGDGVGMAGLGCSERRG